jgi:hypothetical protein
MDKLPLTRPEVAAVIEYVYWHTRATNGKARKVYEKMQAFLVDDTPKQRSFEFGDSGRRKVKNSCNTQ